MTIHFHRSGHGAPLLMLHGLGLDRRAWNGLSALSDSFELMSCDLPGHGETLSPPVPYGIGELSELIAAALRQAGLSKTHVIGHDLGGVVAQHLAANEPGLVGRLVLCATTPTFNDNDQTLWRQHAAMAREAGAGAIAHSLEPDWFTPEFLALNPPALHLMRDSFAACSAEGMALNCEALATADLIDLAGEIYARTLVLVGDSDTLAYREAADWLAQSIAGAKLAIVPHAAHVPMLEQPGWMTDVLRTFLG